MNRTLLSTILCVSAAVALSIPAAAAIQSASRASAKVGWVSPGQPHLQIAGGKAANAGKAPERGSSASLYGGSSADRYGGTSADNEGVGGRRDARLYRKPSKKDDDVARKPRDEDDQRQDVEEEDEP